MDKSYLILMGTGFVLVFLFVLFMSSRMRQKRKIEQKTAYLELQGYKRKLRKENALKYLDNDVLVSLDNQKSSKNEVELLKSEAERQIKEKKFQEERLIEDNKNRRNYWTGS